MGHFLMSDPNLRYTWMEGLDLKISKLQNNFQMIYSRLMSNNKKVVYKNGVIIYYVRHNIHVF